MKTREKKREEATSAPAEERTEESQIQAEGAEDKRGGSWIFLIFLVPLILILVWGFVTR